MQTAARLALLGGLFWLGGNPAHAADQGECGTPEEMTAKFRAEGQHSFATADQQVREKAANGEMLNRLFAVILTINDDLSTGYVLKSDKDSSVKAGNICVYLRLADLRVFDARKPGIQTGALLKSQDLAAKQHCDELIKAKTFDEGTCGPYNTLIRKGEDNGENVMVQGFNVTTQPGGSVRKDGTLTTLVGNVNGTLRDDSNQPLKGIIGGLYYTSLPDGATIINMALVYPHYTPYATDLLDKTRGR